MPREIISEFADISTIHGMADLVRARSIPDRIFWAIALIGAVCSIPVSIVTILRDFQEAPTMTLMTPYKGHIFEFPLVRFCPQSFVNVSELEKLNVSRETFIYALSLLKNVRITQLLELNISTAEQEAKAFMKSRNFTDIKQLFLATAYDKQEIFECSGCKSNGITPVVTVSGVCYDFKYEHYDGPDIDGQNPSSTLVYWPFWEDYSDPRNPNAWYRSSYTTHILYINVHDADFFGLDPLFLNSNRSYTIELRPRITISMPEMGRKKCLDKAAKKSKPKSFEMCQSNCREWLYGWRCWRYMHYGMSFDEKDKQPLPWRSSLAWMKEDEFEKKKNKKKAVTDTPQEIEKLANLTMEERRDKIAREIEVRETECETKYLDELMKCMNSCYTDCQQWHYDVLVSTGEKWNMLSAPANVTNMTAAEYFVWHRHGEATRKRDADFEGDNVTQVTFHYFHRHVPLIEEIARHSYSTVISSVGGMMSLVAGASALSLVQMFECVSSLWWRRVKRVRERFCG